MTGAEHEVQRRLISMRGLIKRNADGASSMTTLTWSAALEEVDDLDESECDRLSLQLVDNHFRQYGRMRLL
jgi:hypothetical protein